MLHGKPTIKFTLDEIYEFTREEGLHQEIVIIFTYGQPNLNDIHTLIPQQLGIKGNILKETSIALTWISFPSLPPNLFAGKVLLSIASADRKPLAIDKATQIRSRPSTTRMKLLVDLLDNHSKLKFDVQEGLVQPSLEANNVEQLKGDAIAFLNAKRDGNQMAEVSSTKELASTNLNVYKVMENATTEVNNNATNLINESIVELGQQISQNRGVTSEKSNLATIKLISTGDGEVVESFELCKANFLGRENIE
ncbi:hypothetical protein H5410_005796 [Solanum commersonii]|uniref:Uncharacterized protein n=1 Tax=Solanum commersonii TaxID=4109 RepID=A0A9J6A8F2_SOLCO|nr:hypothetical protein H5410_005796 [Solanum commersonii]